MDIALRSLHPGAARLEIEAPTSVTTRKQKVKKDPRSVDMAERIELLTHIEELQRAVKGVTGSNTTYMDEIDTYHLTNSQDADMHWEEVRVRVFSEPVARDGGRIRYSFASAGGTCGFEVLSDPKTENEVSRSAEEAVALLRARSPPKGTMTVIADPSVSGLLAHEVMGHASEADEIVKKRSFLTDAVGREVGSNLVTMVDDGTIAGKNGTHVFDSEGTQTSRTVIIDHGIYKGYIHSLETASLMGASPTGNGLAQDFNRRVFVRMTNTFFEGGDSELEELIEDTPEGLLALKDMSGMEDPVGGGFEGKILMGYEIKNGRLGQLVNSFTLTGNALTILKSVDGLTKGVEFGCGSCGKGEEDGVPVSVGGPYMRCRMLVGGD
jgi:TldD protein